MVEIITIRKKAKLTKIELALFFGVEVLDVHNWERGDKKPDLATITLYKLLSVGEKAVVQSLIELACEKRYVHISDVRAVQSLIAKFIDNYWLVGLMEMCILIHNPQWNDQDLGFRVKFESKIVENSDIAHLGLH